MLVRSVAMVWDGGSKHHLSPGHGLPGLDLPPPFPRAERVGPPGTHQLHAEAVPVRLSDTVVANTFHVTNRANKIAL